MKDDTVEVKTAQDKNLYGIFFLWSSRDQAGQKAGWDILFVGIELGGQGMGEGILSFGSLLFVEFLVLV